MASIAWEETVCPSCAQGGFSFFLKLDVPPINLKDKVPALLKCSSCGLVYLSPRPTPETIGECYPSLYPPHLSEQTGLVNEPQIESLPGKGSSLLDVGCGAGKFLLRMRRAGWQVTGIDLSPNAVHSARAMGIEVLEGSLPHPGLHGRQFDWIFIRQVLEHLHNPYDVLLSARDLLPHQGKLSLSVPNLNSLGFRWFQQDWFGIDFPRHLTFYTKETLAGLVEKAGFKVVDVQSLRHTKWLVESAQLSVSLGRSGFKGRICQYRLLASAASWVGFCLGMPESIQLLATRL